jgi:hypothetical protein
MKLSLMLSILGITIAVISSAGCTSLTAWSTSANQTIDGITIPTTTGSPTPSEVRQIAAAAYVYGYPLVFMDSLKEHQTAVPAPDPARGLAPINQIMRAYQVPIAKFQFHSAAAWPITDASYIGAWLDLTKEPMVLSVPESNGRYYVIMLEDAWTNDLLPVGPRTTGDGPGNFAIVGPEWNGTLPSDVTKIQSTTNAVMIAGRTQLNGPADLPATAAFLDNVTMTPLSAWNTNYTPPAAVPVTSNVTPEALASAIAEYVANMSPDAFYGRMAMAMGSNPPLSVDKPVLDQIARIGIVPGTSFNWSSMNATMQDAIAQGAKDGIVKVNAAAANWPGAAVVNGWKVVYDMGAYGTNYTLRAGLAAGYGAGNLAEDALYWWSFTNATGIPYTGENNYVLHFAGNSTPPVKGFWSVTLYDSEGHYVPNPLSQFAITSHSGNPRYNTDGSLDIYVQKASPGADKESNWLPAPSGGFMLLLRQYWPQESALNGSWVPPAVKTAGPATTTTNATTSAA